ncbi:aminotransferase class IV [Caproicibacter sp.]|uniref:aminotransferase class IV n=1 Tax=Caproicibacter sp. TaxID=2814884 RepID=UPI00398A2844
MKNIGYYNGKTGPIEEMTIPMNDRVVYFGDGVYDATYAVNHVIFALEDHIDRFFRSFSKLKIPFAMSKEELAKTLQELVDQVENSESLMVYWQTTRGTGMRNHVFPDGPANLFVTIRPNPLTAIDRTLKLITVEDTRFLHCDIKTLNLIPSVMAAQAAKEAGCQEAVFHRGETVTECAHSNVSIIKNGVFRTAPLNNLILPGTARKHLVALAAQVGMQVSETPFTVAELMDADEVIVHSSGTLCNAAVEIDGKTVGGRAPELLKKLQDAAVKQFEDYTKVKFADYAK